MKKQRNRNIFYLLFMMAILGGGQVLICSGQDLEKSILSEEYLNKNRKASLTPKAGGNRGPKIKPAAIKNSAAKKRTYRKVRGGKFVKPPLRYEEAMLGLTVWRERPAKKNEEGDATKGLIEQESGDKIALERLESETSLEIGDRVRLTVESLRQKGYLYVVNRELFSDGTYGQARLIYPTRKTIRRNIPIGPGDLTFIPESTSFQITPLQNEKTQIAEVLTIIISPKILIEDSILKQKALDLPPAQFDDWLKWEVETALIEQENGAGQVITPKELSAAAGEAPKGLIETLTQDDAPAQSVFRGLIKRGDPFVVNVFLKFSSK